MSMLLSEVNSKGVRTITLSRPKVHNAFNDELIDLIIKEFESAEEDKKTRLIVLTGSGKSFCAGADLNWMKSMKDYTKEENFKDSKKLAKMFHIINQCTKPVIGKINGHALGGGVGLVSVCDFAHASEAALFGFTEVRLGLIPAVISPYVINKIGESNGRAYFLSGTKFDANKAKELNLVHAVSSTEKFDEEFVSTLNTFLKAAPEAAMKAKLLVKSIQSLDEANVEDFTCMAISEQRVSGEGQEGMSALLEKRSPRWNDDQ